MQRVYGPDANRDWESRALPLLEVTVHVEDEVDRSASLAAIDVDTPGGAERHDRVIGPGLAGLVVDRRDDGTRRSRWEDREEARPVGRLRDGEVHGQRTRSGRDSALSRKNEGSRARVGQGRPAVSARRIACVQDAAGHDGIEAAGTGGQTCGEFGCVAGRIGRRCADHGLSARDRENERTEGCVARPVGRHVGKPQIRLTLAVAGRIAAGVREEFDAKCRPRGTIQASDDGDVAGANDGGCNDGIVLPEIARLCVDVARVVGQGIVIASPPP